MSNFWRIVAMGATAAAAFAIAKEVVERHEKGEDCSPKAVLKGIGKKVGDFFQEKCGYYYDEDFDDFDDFEDFELDDDDDAIEFDVDDMDSDKLTDDGYILEFSADEEEKPEEAPAPAPEAAPEEEAAETEVKEEEEE